MEQSFFPSPIRVLLVDDIPTILSGLGVLFATQTDIVIIGQAQSAHEAFTQIAQQTPQVVVMDIHLPDMSSAIATQRIRQNSPAPEVLGYSRHAEADVIQAMIIAGAKGYVLKDEPQILLLDGIRAIAHGGFWLSPKAWQVLYAETDTALFPHLAPTALTLREQQLLNYLLQGHSVDHIAAELQRSPKTVRNTLSALYTKLGVQSRREATAWAHAHEFPTKIK
jgi:DNA-binding NarL/FixJ family response regulator